MTTIQSVQRALSILELFSYARPDLSLAEISQELGLAKATAHNLIRTLEGKGFLSQDAQTRRYRLGSRLLALGAIMSGTLELNRMAASRINKLADSTGLVCRAAVWDGDAVLVTMNAAPKYSESQVHRVGPRVEAYCASLGRAILAFMEPGRAELYLERVKLVALTPRTLTDKDRIREELAATRERGYAVNNQEMALGRASLAAPVRGREGEVAAAISLTGSPEQILGENRQKLAGELFAVVDEVSRSLGFMPGMAGAA